jgi:2-(1,2-epoxy-1,2-dihydrophenyl)acetyl-CoA isomerase
VTSPPVRVETGTDTVLAEIADGVGIVTLNRPERRNALHPEMYDGVPVALERFAADPAVGCIVVTGAGTGFCSGGDVRDGRRRPAEGAPLHVPSVDEAASALAHNARMVTMLHDSAKVTIAALPGPAVGAGIGIALAADLRIAARSARLVPGWSQLAFSGDFGGSWFLTRMLGAARTLEIMLDNTTLDAATCERLGLFNRVVDDDVLHTAALAWARSIAAGPRAMQGYVKANVRDASRLSLADALPFESERMVRSGQTDEHVAAVKAWLARAAARRDGR